MFLFTSNNNNKIYKSLILHSIMKAQRKLEMYQDIAVPLLRKRELSSEDLIKLEYTFYKLTDIEEKIPTESIPICDYLERKIATKIRIL